MLKQILSTALIAGFCGGVAVSLLQMALVTPLILEAETYESGGANDPTAASPGETHSHDSDPGGQPHEHGENAWEPQDGMERTLYTLLANIVTATGFALLLCAGYALYGQVDARQGVFWGLAGFAAFGLAPALGLPPEIPGSVSAPLFDRQVWWLATVAGTISGIALAVLGRKISLRVLGGGLILLPHLVGAPHPESYGGSAPPELAAHFAVATLVTGAIFWIVLGGLSGFLFQKLGDR